MNANHQLIAQNLLILHQLEGLGQLFARERIPVIVLKGAALIAAVPDYLAGRHLEDIDLLARPGDLPRTRALLVASGYRAVPEDPCAYNKNGAAVSVDLNDRLWYLDKRQNDGLWNEGITIPLEGMPGGMYRLNPDDMYIHILAHAAVHHTRKEGKWMADLALLRKRWMDEMDVSLLERKLKLYGLSEAAAIFLNGSRPRSLSALIYSLLLRHGHPESGHISRFLFLPPKRKVSYMVRTLFPPHDFLISRYNVRGKMRVWLYRIIRPLLLLGKLISVTIPSVPAH